MGGSSSTPEDIDLLAGSDTYLNRTPITQQKALSKAAIRDVRTSAAPPKRNMGTVLSIQDSTYRLLRKLGEGQYGQLWVAVPTEDPSREVAIKFIPAPDPRVIRAELNAFEAVRELCNSVDPAQRVLPCLEAAENFRGKLLALVMSKINGPTASDWLAEGPREELDEHEFVRFLFLFLVPVEQLHQLGTTHGDLKPSNTIVDASVDQVHRVSLVDFGLSCTAVLLQQEGASCHTRFPEADLPAHMDPAFRDGIVNRFQADVYSAGWCIRWFVHRQLPARGSALAGLLNGIAKKMMSRRTRTRPTIQQAQHQLLRLLYDRDDVIRFKGEDLDVVDVISSTPTSRVLHVRRGDQSFALKLQDLTPSLRRELFLLRGMPRSMCEDRLLPCLHDVDEDEALGTAALLLEYFPEGDLLDYLQTHPPEGAKDLVGWLCGITRALRRLHDIGVASLDVKLSNFLVVDGATHHVAITDFGVSSSTAMERDFPDLTPTPFTSPKHKSPHLAPETFRRPGLTNIFKADVYSLGYAFRQIAAATQGDGSRAMRTVLGRVTKLSTLMMHRDALRRPSLLQVEASLPQLE